MKISKNSWIYKFADILNNDVEIYGGRHLLWLCLKSSAVCIVFGSVALVAVILCGAFGLAVFDYYAGGKDYLPTATVFEALIVGTFLSTFIGACAWNIWTSVLRQCDKIEIV